MKNWHEERFLALEEKKYSFECRYGWMEERPCIEQEDIIEHDLEGMLCVKEAFKDHVR